MKVLVLSVVVVVLFSLVQSMYISPSVQIEDGLVTGKRINFSGHEVNQYLGVPYAQPPVGPLRFKKPVPLSDYSSISNAFNNPPACPQYSVYPYPWYINSTEKSEDCLYLNIWTPADASPTNKKAVLYWMHGGGFRHGSIRDELYSGVPLASMGDVLVVTVNYRVGAFGFFSSGTSDAPGNVGLYDVLEGLRWVNKYIGSFGGDVARITFGGESAGAIAAGALAASPQARGLYARQIAESGSSILRIVDNSNTRNVALAQQLATTVGCANDTFTIEVYPEEVVRCLRGIDAVTLSVGEFLIAPHAPYVFAPQWNDDFLPNNPRKSFISGDFECTDLLIGHNTDEGIYLMTTSDPELYGFFGEKDPYINKSLGEDTIRTSANLYPNPQAIVEHYLPPYLTDDSHHSIRHQAYTALGDLLFHCPTVYYAEKCAEQGKNVFYYVFKHRPSVSPWAPWIGIGAAHFEELQFVFGQPVLNPQKYSPSEVVLSRQMIGIWTSFIRDGEDPAFKNIGPEYVSGTNTESGPHSDCDFLRPFYGF